LFVLSHDFMSQTFISKFIIILLLNIDRINVIVIRECIILFMIYIFQHVHWRLYLIFICIHCFICCFDSRLNYGWNIL